MKALLLLLLLPIGAALAGTADRAVVISVPDQKLAIVEKGQVVDSFRVSTSRFGVGDSPRSYRTPLGELEVAQKIGYNAPLGAVFKGRQRTGEILRPNSAGRDPIVTRIICLRGREEQNRNAFDRGIYIHGTPVERAIGHPTSYGCIRMRSRDVVEVFRAVTIGTPVIIVNVPLRQHLAKPAGEATASHRPASGKRDV